VTPERQKRIQILKDAIANGQYNVDCRALADAIIRRARLRLDVSSAR
jgi:anti-sigma28 factor (negative regulator of flagellin synthesis)